MYNSERNTKDFEVGHQRVSRNKKFCHYFFPGFTKMHFKGLYVTIRIHVIVARP